MSKPKASGLGIDTEMGFQLGQVDPGQGERHTGVKEHIVLNRQLDFQRQVRYQHGSPRAALIHQYPCAPPVRVL